MWTKLSFFNIIIVKFIALTDTVPESAVDPQFTSIGRDYVVLTWDNPAGMIDSYNISYYPVNDITELMFEVVQAAAESNVLTVNGLNEGMNYSFTVVSLLEVETDLQEMGAPVEVFAGKDYYWFLLYYASVTK